MTQLFTCHFLGYAPKVNNNLHCYLHLIFYLRPTHPSIHPSLGCKRVCDYVYGKTQKTKEDSRDTTRTHAHTQALRKQYKANFY